MQLKKENYYVFIKMLVLQIVFTFVTILLFATFMYFTESGFGLAPLFATISLSVGCFAASLYLGLKIEKKGIFIGLLVGGITFLIITLITLAVNSSGVTAHLFLRLVIMLLTSMIGGIIGVNRKAEQKYI